jgi:uncharacterized membrane protein
MSKCGSIYLKLQISFIIYICNLIIAVFLFCEQLQKLVVENVLAFNESFWIRLAARTETCKSEDDKACFLT